MNFLKKVCLFLLVTYSSTLGAQEKQLSLIKAYFSKLETGNSGWDFTFMDSIVKQKKIIALGEATHGTKEFFDTKREFFKYLVQKHQFNVFAIEANMADAEVANSYVMNRSDDSTKAMESLLFWTWNTKEVLSLLTWMREYNSNLSDAEKIKFYGFDMQTPNTSIEYLLKTTSENKVMQLSAINGLTDGKRKSWEQIPPDLGSAVKLELDNLKSTKNNWGNASDQIALHIRLVEQYLVLRASKGQNNSVRDEFMAENISWIADREGKDTKIMVWAHNMHVSKLKELVSFVPMGYHLHKHFSEKFLTIGFAFNSGEFRAINDHKLKVNYLGISKPKSLPSLLSQFKIPAGYLDLNGVEADRAAKKVITEYKGFRQFGAAFNPTYNYYSYRPAFLMFDGLFFFDKTTSAVPN